MSETFYETLYAIFNVKFQVAVFVLILTGSAALIIKNATNSFGFAALFVPALGFGAFAGVFVCKMAEIHLTTNKNVNVLATATLGMLLAFITMLLVVRASGYVRDLSRPIDLDGRTQEAD